MSATAESSDPIESIVLNNLDKRELEIDGKIYYVIDSPKQDVGIYLRNGDQYQKLSNFIIKINKQIENKFKALLEYSVLIAEQDQEIVFQKPASEFYTSSNLKKDLVSRFAARIFYQSQLWKILPTLSQKYSINSIEFVKKEDETVSSPQIEFPEGLAFSASESNPRYLIATSEDRKYSYYVIELDLYKISDFIIEFDEQIRTQINGINKSTYFTGIVFISDELQYLFEKVHIDVFTDKNKLKRFIINLCGIDVLRDYTNWESVIRAIFAFNHDVPEIITRNFGYNKDLTEFATENLLITADGIEELRNPLFENGIFGNNKLEFIKNDEKSLAKLNDKIINDFLHKWDKPEVMYPTIAFTMLPIIYPWLTELNSNKPFLMLKGVSGSGKTTLAHWMQRFYGKFDTLLSWTSTEASINYTGNIFNNALLVLDDFKHENFVSQSDRLKAMRMLQNYSDGTGRQRANGVNNISVDKTINGFLLISAEDNIITQTSTLARGIVLDVEKKEPNTSLLNSIESMSKEFTAFTTHYIRHIIASMDKEIIRQYYKMGLIIYEAYAEHFQLSMENRSRIVKNFALLSTSWGCLREFLYKNTSYTEDDKKFTEATYNIIVKNFEKIDNRKSYVKFQNALLELSAMESLFKPAAISGGLRGSQKIGWYEVDKDDSSKIRICLNLNMAFKKINSYLSSRGGIGTSIETLEAQLLENELIRKTDSGRISFADGKKLNGVEWNGEPLTCL